MNYLIVGSGPSVARVKDYDYSSLSENVIVLAVNTSIMFLNHADMWFSVDSSSLNIRCSKLAQDAGIPVVWCVSDNSMVRPSVGVTIFKKKYNPKKLNRTPLCPEDWLVRWGCVLGFSDQTNVLHTGNSVYTAMNLAYLDNPRKIALLGVDGSKNRSIGGNHAPGNLTHLPLLFESAIEQLARKDIQVLNGSPDSSVTCFERASPEAAIEWINMP